MKNFLRLALATTTIPLLVSFFANSALAHVYSSDGPINVTLHIEPDDDPIIGSPATLFYTIADKESKFTTSLCNCTVSISESGKQIFHQTIATSSAETSMTAPNSAQMQMTGPNTFDVSYTFPRAAVYTILLTASPTAPGAFHAFTSSFDFRVTRQGSSPSASAALTNSPIDWTPILEGGAIMLLFLIPVVMVLIKFLRSRLAHYPSPTKAPIQSSPPPT